MTDQIQEMGSGQQPQETAPKSTRQRLHETIERRRRQGKGPTPQQRRILTSLQTIDRRMEANEALSIEEQIALPLAEASTKAIEQGKTTVEVDELSATEQLALLNYIGYETGMQILGWAMNAGRVTKEAAIDASRHAKRIAKGSYPVTAPVAVVAGARAHEYALSNPELAAMFLAGDKIGIIGAGLTYLLYKIVRDGLKGRPPLDTISETVTKKLDAIRQDPQFKIPQQALFAAATFGGAIALADPEGAGTTVAPVLYALGTAPLSHKITKILISHVMEDAGRREEGQLIDDNVLLLSASVDTAKDLARNVIRNVRDKEIIQRLWGSLRGEKAGLNVGVLEDLVDELTKEPGANDRQPDRGGHTGRHQQHPQRH